MLDALFGTAVDIVKWIFVIALFGGLALAALAMAVQIVCHTLIDTFRSFLLSRGIDPRRIASSGWILIPFAAFGAYLQLRR